MAKTRKLTTAETRKTTRPLVTTAPFNVDEVIHRYIWVLVPFLVLVYYWFSQGSTGFYQDDEIGHARNILNFFADPFSIMGNQPKPGWKILVAVSGLFGLPGIALMHCLISALTVVATYYLGRALSLRNASLGAILLAAQPLYLQLSFRSYSEITAGLFVVLMILFYYQERWLLAALCSSYIFSIRQEFALVSIGLGILFLMKKRWIPFLALGWTPLVLALIGWLGTGNMMWLLDDMRKIGLGVEVPHKPFWHYFETMIFIVGPISLALLHVGFWSLFSVPSRMRQAITEHGFLFFTFTIMFGWAVFSAWDLPNFGANPGHWRYLLSIAPLVAVYGVKGFNAFFEKETKTSALLSLGIFFALVLFFLHREANGLVLTEVVSYTNAGIVGVFFLAVLGLRTLGPRTGPAALLALTMLGAISVTVATEKPRTLDGEAQTMKQVAEWYLTQPYSQRPLYGNHVLFRYFAGIHISDKNRDRSMEIATLATAPIGSIVVWDSHYGNSQFGGDVAFPYFEQHRSSYRLLREFISPDQRFGALVFEKIAELTPVDSNHSMQTPNAVGP